MVVIASLAISPVYAIPPELTKAVPADIVAAYFVSRPDAKAESRDTRSILQVAAFLADQAFQVGLLSRVDMECRAWIDVLISLPAILRHPHSVVLMKSSARQRPDGGHELAGLHAALIIHTRGDNLGIERRIQHLLNSYTNQDESILRSRSSGGRVLFTLQDRRLPPWAIITWGKLGDYYVVAIGDGAYEGIAETAAGAHRSLAADAWFKRAASRVPGASVAWYVQLDHLRREVVASLAKKIVRVQAALGLAGAQRSLWTVGRNGRSIEIHSVVRRSGRDEVRTIAGPDLWDRFSMRSESVIPVSAGGYAVIDCNPRTVLRGVRDAYFAAKSPHAVQHSRDFWQDLEDATGVSIEGDIFSQLGRPVVIHNYPRHALRLPFAWTVMVPIKGDAAVLRSRIDRLLFAVRQEMSNAESRKSSSEKHRRDPIVHSPFDKYGPLRLHHDPDGVWYIQYGLNGPALTVTDRWIIISYSPHAIRANTAILSTRPPP